MAKPNDRDRSSKPAPGDTRPVALGELGLVATPIGNLGDLSARAAEYLRAADAIACEDSRITIRLLQHLNIKKPLLSYHDHNAEEMRPRLIERLQHRIPHQPPRKDIHTRPVLILRPARRLPMLQCGNLR